MPRQIVSCGPPHTLINQEPKWVLDKQMVLVAVVAIDKRNRHRVFSCTFMYPHPIAVATVGYGVYCIAYLYIYICVLNIVTSVPPDRWRSWLLLIAKQQWSLDPRMGFRKKNKNTINWNHHSPLEKKEKGANSRLVSSILPLTCCPCFTLLENLAPSTPVYFCLMHPMPRVIFTNDWAIHWPLLNWSFRSWMVWCFSFTMISQGYLRHVLDILC